MFYANQVSESFKIKGEEGQDFEPCENLPEGWRYRYMKSWLPKN